MWFDHVLSVKSKASPTAHARENLRTHPLLYLISILPLFVLELVGRNLSEDGLISGGFISGVHPQVAFADDIGSACDLLPLLVFFVR